MQQISIKWNQLNGLFNFSCMKIDCINPFFKANSWVFVFRSDIHIHPQIPKKTPVSSAAPIKFIITKTVNSKSLSPQTSVTPVIAGELSADLQTRPASLSTKRSFSHPPHLPAGRVVTQTQSPVMPPRTIALSEPHNTNLQNIASKKIAISPLKTPSKARPHTFLSHSWNRRGLQIPPPPHDDWSAECLTSSFLFSFCVRFLCFRT